jgi:hypothetical protein
MENPFPAEPHTSAHIEPPAVAQPELSQTTEALIHKASSAGSEDLALPSPQEIPAEGRDQEETPPPEPADAGRTLELPFGDAAPAHQPLADSHPAPNQEEQSTDAESFNHEPGSLADFAARSRKGRLSSEEETESILVLKEALLGGRADVAQAVTATPFLPWVVSVQATTSAWPEMKPSFRTQFLAGLARTQGEQAARIRLSLARGLFKVDQAAALKLILLTLKLLRNKETGLLEGKGPALFANVLIGRGKAWALQLPLQNLKPSEADLLVFAALHGAFHAPQAPIAQLSILKWAAAEQRLTRLPEALEALILKGIARWSVKWQAALRKEVTPLPESWAEALKGAAPKPPQQHSRSSGGKTTQSEHNEEQVAELQEEDDSIPTQSETSLPPSNEGREPEENEDDDEDEDLEEHEDREEDSRPQPQKQRPVYVSKTVPNHGAQPQQAPQARRGNGPQHFNLQDTLRQIDSYVAGLRNELQSTQKQLRQREEDPRRGRRAERSAPVVVPGDLSTEELLRLNQQLESRNAELKTRLDELTVDSEERAASSGLANDTAAPDPSTQLRALLGLKLKDDYEDFQALQQEARDLVVQQHYRSVLQHVFEVLLAEGVQLPHPGHDTSV